MFAGLRQAIVLSSSECDFRKHWTDSLRGCFITVAEVEMQPYTLARFIEVCQLPRQSLDFIVGIYI